MAIAAAWYRQLYWRPGKDQTVVLAQQSDPWQEHAYDCSSAEHACFAVMHSSQAELLEPTLQEYLCTMAVAAVAESDEKGKPDIWDDSAVLQYLRTQQYDAAWSAAEKERIRKRASSYTLSPEGVLRRKLADGSSKICPKPADRKQLILQHHERNGHYGVRRTGALIQHAYWWWGLWADVASELSKCSLCHRVRSTFNSPRPELQPLPISGLEYRWGVDLCGPFPESAAGNLFCMVAV